MLIFFEIKNNNTADRWWCRNYHLTDRLGNIFDSFPLCHYLLFKKSACTCKKTSFFWIASLQQWNRFPNDSITCSYSLFPKARCQEGKLQHDSWPKNNLEKNRLCNFIRELKNWQLKTMSKSCVSSSSFKISPQFLSLEKKKIKTQIKHYCAMHYSLIYDELSRPSLVSVWINGHICDRWKSCTAILHFSSCSAPRSRRVQWNENML